MAVVFVKNQMDEFVATRDFSLNFEDRKLKSQKIRKDDMLLYDGDFASYTTRSGEVVSGRCPSLKSAINVMGWLVPNGQINNVLPKPSTLIIGNATSDYNAVKGGSFDSYANQHRNEIHVAQNPAIFKKLEIVKENDLIVKTNISPKKEATVPVKSEKFEVSGDQVEVKKGFTVNSSTSGNKENKRKMEVVQADEGGSAGTVQMTGLKKANDGKAGKKKNSYIVDQMTPAIPAEDVTLRDVRKITNPSGTTNVISVEESQDAMVVGKIDMKRGRNEVQEIEGITLKRPAPRKEEAITAKVSGSKEMTIKTTVSAGSTPIVDVGEEGIVIKEKTPEEKAALAKAAAAKAAARKASSVKTETEVLTRAGKTPKAPDFDPIKGGNFETAAAQEAVNVSVIPQPKKAEAVDTTDFLSQLPADWGTMHWVKKEKFIKSLTDVAFIKFILSVETIKAVQNACQERLKEIKEGIN